jgi:predicted dehydrogenase
MMIVIIIFRVKKEWVIKALKAGKHVVLEKPVAVTASDYEEILSVAYANNKFVMDGTMFPHHKRTRDILEYVADEKVGHVNRVECNFTFMTDDAWQDDNIRARKDGDPHGCIGDLGWYCICYGLMVFSKLGSNPKSAQVVDFEVTKHGVPLDATCVVRFEDVSAKLRCSSCS